MNNTALTVAIHNNDLERVKYLVSVGCDPKEYDNSAIRIASYNGHLEIVKYLVSLGCDPKTKDNEARCS